MTKKEEVFNKLKDMSAEESGMKHGGFAAGEVGEALGMSRANVSRILNDLAANNLIYKESGKPVRFSAKLHDRISDNCGASDISFDNLVGNEHSLKMAIRQAKASVLYPGNVLNVLLTGETGVGKTTFAELIYKYAHDKGKITSGGRFVVFNCSEYADNPQLLLSQLFGHVKGAFTGAETDKKGLIEKADGGILLLDEIHRLAPEGQEMLFHFIDNGKFRRLGESENTKTAAVMLIAATTEKPPSYLLKAFIRRFPMIIEIPPLAHRPVAERRKLIGDFFRMESKEVGVNIRVSDEVMELLLTYPCPSNVGQLRADIRLLCADGLLENMDNDKRDIHIDETMLPAHISRYKAEKSVFDTDGFVLIPAKESMADSLIEKIHMYIYGVNVEFKTKYEMTEAFIRDTERERVILTTCVTGEGTAAKLAQRIQKDVPEIAENGIKVVSLDMGAKDGAAAISKYGKGVMAVVGTVNPDISDIPFISLEDFIIGDGIKELTRLIDGDVEGERRDFLKSAERIKVTEMLRSSTAFIDVDKVYGEAVEVFKTLDLKGDYSRLRSLEVRFIIHLACMLERLIQNLSMEYTESYTVSDDKKKDFLHIKKSMERIERAFSVIIPDGEIVFLCDLIYTD